MSAKSVSSLTSVLSRSTITLAGAVMSRRAGRVAFVATAAAPPLVALGFVLGHPLPQVGGAVLMSVGVLLTATLQLADAAAGTERRWWLLVSGLAPWVPMVLAVSWAASNHWPVPALSIPDMARTHGVMNVVFVVAGLWARRTSTTGAQPAPADGLRAWACHPGIGASVHPPDASIEVGTSLLVMLPFGPISTVVPDRVVAVLDEPRRFGFAYGTLEGHQERGEECFVVEHLDDDRVVASIGLDAVAATPAARLVAPAVGLFQRLAVRRYLAALAATVST